MCIAGMRQASRATAYVLNLLLKGSVIEPAPVEDFLDGGSRCKSPAEEITQGDEACLPMQLTKTGFRVRGRLIVRCLIA